MSSLSLTAVRICTAAGLALVAPLEHTAGVAIGLGDVHAWAVSLTVESASAAALLSGHYVGAALVLTGSSTLLGVGWSTSRYEDADPSLRYILAFAVTALVCSALSLAHGVRVRIMRAESARAGAEERTRALAEADERERIAAERRARVEADERARAYDLEKQRLQGYQEQRALELKIESERVRQHAFERAQVAQEAHGPSAQVAQEAHGPSAHARPMRASRVVPDEARMRVRDEWRTALEEGAPWTGAQLAERLGVSAQHARKIAATWRAAADN